MYRRLKLCSSLKAIDIDFYVTDYFFVLDDSYLYTEISTSCSDDDYDRYRYYYITLSNGDSFSITANSENEEYELPIKYSDADNRSSMFKPCVSGKYLIRPNVKSANKTSGKKTIWVKYYTYNDGGTWYIYINVSEVLQETVQLRCREWYSYENIDEGEGNYVSNYHEYNITIEKGRFTTVSNKVKYYNIPTYADWEGFTIASDSDYYVFEHDDA